MRSPLGSIDDLGDGRYKVSVSLGYSAKTGKRIRPTVTVRGTRRDAERVKSQMVMRAGKLAPEKITLESFIEDVWLPTKDGQRRKTVLGYKSKVRTCIVPYLGTLPVQGVTPYLVERWLSDLASDGMSPQTIIHARAVLKNAMRAAVRWKLIDSDPTAGTERPKVKYRPAILDGAQMAQLLDGFAGHELEPIVVMCVAAGLRRSEACGLEWSDIDFTASTVSIRRGLHQYGSDVWPEDPKSDTSRRVVALPAWALERLRDLRAVGPLVPEGGSPMPPDKVSRLYAAHVADTGLPSVPLRNLRNSHGTYLVAQGLDVSRVAGILGHKDERVTKAHYIDRDSLPLDTGGAAIIEGIFSRQKSPNICADTVKPETESVSEAPEKQSKAQ